MALPVKNSRSFSRFRKSHHSIAPDGVHLAAFILFIHFPSFY
ncbi:hypothetical protein HMPREF0454_00129 [Hafnia alvei ATCC 51873]|uniref:Uncharacterized protein n=1 Tax=Hafnia alvei ATCC 51873 TaxID=1002364 RepID=G9Y0S1_HAFAL|nr:hypothetical protein HMPREF0454_00129 [Hafnia alvei ATCC 51873]